MIKRVKQGYQVLSSKGRILADHTGRWKKPRRDFVRWNTSSATRRDPGTGGRPATL